MFVKILRKKKYIDTHNTKNYIILYYVLTIKNNNKKYDNKKKKFNDFSLKNLRPCKFLPTIKPF